MKSYLFLNQSDKGQVAVSSFVFNQLALEALKELASDDLKGSFVYDEKLKNMNVESDVDKDGKVTITVSIKGILGKDMQKVSQTIQEKIYENVLEMFEISKISVNISILGMQEKK